LSPDYVIVSFSHTRWDDPMWRNRHQVLTRLARFHPVIWVEAPTHWRKAFRPKKKPQPTGLCKVGENLYVWRPPRWLPTMYRRGFVARFLERTRFALLRRAARRLAKDAFVYVWDAELARYTRAFPKARVAYHVYDEKDLYLHHSPEETAFFRASEATLLKKADVVFAVSEPIRRKRTGRSANVVLMPNGVSEEFLADDPGPAPDDVASVPRPRIGYVGGLNPKVDFELLTSIARKRPDWNIVVVGPLNAKPEGDFARDLAEFDAQPNTRRFGFCPRKDLPRCMRALDVGLLCYRTDTWAKSCSPLKLYEFYGQGVPLVSPDIEAVQDISPPLRIARTADEWVRAIEETLRADPPEQAAARRRAAAENTWEERVSRIREELDSLFVASEH